MIDILLTLALGLIFFIIICFCVWFSNKIDK